MNIRFIHSLLFFCGLTVWILFPSCDKIYSLDDPHKPNSIRKENDSAPAEYEITEEDIITFYCDLEDMKGEQPYTYIMNKYLDLATFYLMGTISSLEIDTVVIGKIEILQTIVNAYNESDEHLELCALGETEFDIYFNDLYEAMYAEIEQISCIQNYENIAIGFAEADGGEEMILEENEPTLTIGGTVYSKVELLRVYEKGIALPYEYEDEYEDIDDPAPEIIDLDEDANNLSNPRMGLRYRLLALWPRTIRYRIYKSKCPNLQLLQQAMVAWTIADNYFINFSQISDNGWNRFTWGIGCNYHLCVSKETDPNCGGSSSICCVPWATMKISSGPHIRPYLHELGHVLCFVHEAQRADRDNYIRINYDNIKSGYKSQFWKYCSAIALPICTFDYKSIMMYSQNAFSKNGQNTIDRTDGVQNWYYPNQISLSSKDVTAVRNVYHY